MSTNVKVPSIIKPAPQAAALKMEQVVYQMALLGATNAQIAAALDVGIDRFRRMLGKQPALKELLKQGRLVADGRVARTLYRKATGYTYVEDVAVTSRNRQTGEATTTVTPVRKRALPDITAIIFWLCNRQSEKWRSVNKLDAPTIAPTVNLNLQMAELTNEELALARRIGVAMRNGNGNGNNGAAVKPLKLVGQGQTNGQT